MIKYNSGSFGFRLLFRLHGSAVFRSFVPALISSIIYSVLLRTTNLNEDEDQIFDHPYPMGALVSALTFLLAFRANFSYNRYWEAFTAVHQMHSKWMDVGMDLAAFHLQSNKYDNTRPPAFGEHPELTCLERERERLNEPTLSDLEEKIDDIMAAAQQQNDERVDAPAHLSLRQRLRSIFRRRTSTDQANDENQSDNEDSNNNNNPTSNSGSMSLNSGTVSGTMSWGRGSRGAKHGKNITNFLGGMFKKGTAGTWRSKQGVDATMPVQIRTKHHHRKAWKDNQPPLFLQESAHLLSLLSAVAMSTLRNDLEEAGSPLIVFTQGAPWPHVDPDAYGADVRKDWAQSTHRTWTVLSYLFGTTRTPAARTLYNAARPFRVIGGVSDAEIEVLQAARGPYAKVALCTMWVEEFISREHLNGAMGAVGAPIISRVYQFTSDGMLGYNQARKIAYIPFPFPHAQITSLFVLVVVGLMPVLMLSFLNHPEFGFVANLLTVMSFTGLHEVARELESPFTNVPNDIPLNNFQAQFNEALMQMFAGYHPDAYWEIHQQVAEDNDNKEVMDQASYPPTQTRLEDLFKPPEPVAEEHEQESSLKADSIVSVEPMPEPPSVALSDFRDEVALKESKEDV